jgi:hypothetical protein
MIDCTKILGLCSKWLLFALLNSIAAYSFGQSSDVANESGKKLLCLPLPVKDGKAKEEKIIRKYGVPFINDTLAYATDGTAKVNVQSKVKRIYFLGMTESCDGRVWREPNNFMLRHFVGDEIGDIKLNYEDGTTQVFPLKMGESIWWGKLFYDYQEPFRTDAKIQQALAASMHLYPAQPVEDGNYVAVINAKQTPLKNIVIECMPGRIGYPTIAGITVEPADGAGFTNGTSVATDARPAAFEKFVQTKSLRLLNQNDKQADIAFKNLKQALYTNDDVYKGSVPQKIPANYSGPKVSFSGNYFADVLTNAFYSNIQDIIAKIDADGSFHSSTKNAVLFAGNGLGTYRNNMGEYYNESWSRDLGRCLQEIAVLGFTKEVEKTPAYCFQQARLWEEQPSLRSNNAALPRHWSRILNKPTKSTSQENDGHALIAMFLYKYWQRMPNGNQWLHDNWTDIKGAGDWITWQFEHPEITGATNVLHTTGESSSLRSDNKGSTVYADFLCINMLNSLAEMADAYGDPQTATHWRDRANKMFSALQAEYVVNDPKYNKVWTLQYAGWAYKATVLGPLMCLADYQGFAPQNDFAQLRDINAAAYQRVTDTYNKPFGFYGEGMGYGQSFITQSALLLDKMEDATTMMNWIAKEIYDPRMGTFVVPEGCQADSTGKYWYRNGDLGNGVQEAETIKTLRIVIGVDDTHPGRLQFFPRMPYDWNKIAISDYPVLHKQSGKFETAHVHYKLERTKKGMNLNIGSDKQLDNVAFRVGPFKTQPDNNAIMVNGKFAEAVFAKSGDSWWGSFTMSIKQNK